ncbi:hypothetical protein LTR78_010325 [Recurvomyces mirabilis]|uniref:Metallo-beta-lactamase domain-containing protein n=1 Tax=Recurvomyces mirabilis TaxID=574656 RepID=A0AAE0TMF5_9PEZI|nr:hypothetical protein LTR78_010325 [Recurvomyces mirabilis]KAK5149861.1 hypothetical protein LTS14_010576 [Recurvomyces mirabilis]
MGKEDLPLSSADFSKNLVSKLDSIAGPSEPEVYGIFEPSTGRWQYIVACTVTKKALIIDPVLDKTKLGDGLGTLGADNVMAVVLQNGYLVERIVETHIHPDQPSAAWYLRTQLRDAGQDPRISIGKSAASIRRLMERKYIMREPGFTGAFDGEYNDGDCLWVGDLRVLCLKLPGHSVEQVRFLIGGNVFAGGAIPNIDYSGPPSARHLPSADSAASSACRLLTMPRDY